MDNNSQNNNGNGASMEKFRKWLFNEVSFFIAVISMAIGVALFITGPDAKVKQDIALIQQDIINIKDNHLHTLQTTLEEHERVANENAASINELDKKIIKIMVKLGIE